MSAPVESRCVVLARAQLAENVYALALGCGPMAELARPGQFLHIACGEGRLLRRPISICDREGERLRIVFRVKGEGTRWLAARQAGEQLDVLGPLGNGFEPAGKTLLLAGGGIGVPPLLWCAAEAGVADAVLGFGSAAQAILLPEFAARCRQVSVVTEDGSLGRTGFVTGPLRDRLEQGGYDALYACGPVPMLRAVAALAREFDLPCRVSMEQRMGCGVGACLVCSCRIRRADGEHYARVCKDGPVFDAGEVCWDEA